MNHNMNHNIKVLALLLIAAFFVLLGHLTYWQVIHGETLAAHPNNKRAQLLEQDTVRGGIRSADGEMLALPGLPGNKRYSFGRAFAHLVGYSSQDYGKSGLEAAYNGQLLGMVGKQKYINYVSRLFHKQLSGNTLVLTIDSRLQILADRLLGNRRGAVVALNPTTGAVLALVSRPNFDPDSIRQNWQDLIKDPASPLLNRATSGLYPPGSTFKVVTGARALAVNRRNYERIYNSPGYIEVNGRRLNDLRAFGDLTFEQGLMYSSNVVFAQLALEMGAEQFYRGAEAFGFNNDIPFDLPVKISRVPLPRTQNELAESGIGQGKLLVTPLQMALVAAAVANDGVMMQPYLVQKIVDPQGNTVDSFRPKVMLTATTPDIAAKLKQAMVATVVQGTGKSAAISGIPVGGKTGSAENPHGRAHAWFIAFAPAVRPEVAVAVMIENGGAGGQEAAPIAREIIQQVVKGKR